MTPPRSPSARALTVAALGAVAALVGALAWGDAVPRLKKLTMSCTDRVEPLRPWLASLADEGPVLYPEAPSMMPLARLDEPGEQTRGVAIVTLEAGFASYSEYRASIHEKERVSWLLGVSRHASCTREADEFGVGSLAGGMRGLMTRCATELDLFVARDEPWENVASFIKQAAADGLTSLRLVVEQASHLEPPAFEGVARDLILSAQDPRGAAASKRQALDRWDTLYPGCQQARQSADDLAREPSGELLRQFFERNTARLCGCGADEEAIRALAWVLYGRPLGRLTSSFVIVLASSDPLRPHGDFSAPRSALWQEVAPRLHRVSVQRYLRRAGGRPTYEPVDVTVDP